MAKSNPTNTESQSILKALLDTSSEAAVPWSGQELCSILQHQLRTKLTRELDALVETTSLSREELESIVADSGCQTFQDVIATDSRPSEEAIRLVKGFAKASLVGQGPLPPDVARVLYVLAVLRGRRSCIANITALDDTRLRNQVCRCLTFPWLPENVRKLLRSHL